MSQDAAPRRERTRAAIYGLALLLVLAAAGLAVRLWWVAPSPVAAVVAPVSRAPAAPPPVVQATVPPAPAPAGPSFDVVRIGPERRAVIAGRAEPGAEVTVRDGERVLGAGRADASGQFVLLPDTQLQPGQRELTLTARGADGRERAASDSVALLVPNGPAAVGAPAPVAVLLPNDPAASPRLLAAPRRKLGLDTVDYDESGAVRLGGSAPADTPVRVYVDNQPIGDVRAGSDGQWSLAPTTPVTPGLHHLRVDQLGASGRVVGRVELPFQRSAVAAGSGQTVVQPGENLWRIARHSYGQGTRFTLIYLANRDQIRDPSRIYPGQVFAVPPRS